MIIGIDIGGTTTKIVSLSNGPEVQALFTVIASDPVASASGALGKLMDAFHVNLAGIEKIVITGAGASFIKSDIFGIPVLRADEFQAIGMGGLYLSGMKKAVIVSLGTGTAIVFADGSHVEHLGGTGIGGGTLLGLSKCIIGSSDIARIIEIAGNGNLGNTDLTIKDISKTKIGSLPQNATASNFGKISEKAGKGDYALGLINLVFQAIGVMAMFASRQAGVNEIILTGKLAMIPQAGPVFDGLSKVYGVNYHIPKNAGYATAIGAALHCIAGGAVQSG
ncbi:MAG: pantothenate kinase [Brevinematales bacterium]|jgi:type II pantothenate kinase